MSIQVTPLKVDGSYLLTTPFFSDHRGGFGVQWEKNLLDEANIVFRPENANHSYNWTAGTLRAFHYQSPPNCQAKLVSCVAGKIWDVVVDLRSGSPTLHQWAASELAAGDSRSHYIPAGCAHGFVTLEDHSTVAYLIEGTYVAAASAVVRWNDPTLAVPWPVTNPILSDKDRNAPFIR
ncbi:dTDP-4-dehydrorhamnose 3,5-epimerase family protein [Synoicihabitans lomoniglobus]|uniref:dTDP-4-dehydrorhamnose 3,5-epimerase n=1 Tax=Synoicihabitans lomoniglobus TaxID=2909285 RepID=A0AAF0CQS2_9BACT|nr:dTDP-4-dehydrorhamnose 3,5-epimerase family protein [Opitutaceae bacterium LMO-M01]WED66350.1 dTDP-4-dehydrorhamnose 3,5-epimerase family protein [Opitutaceae bacterium LMO-M01]